MKRKPNEKIFFDLKIESSEKSSLRHDWTHGRALAILLKGSQGKGIPSFVRAVVIYPYGFYTNYKADLRTIELFRKDQEACGELRDNKACQTKFKDYIFIFIFSLDLLQAAHKRVFFPSESRSKEIIFKLRRYKVLLGSLLGS